MYKLFQNIDNNIHCIAWFGGGGGNPEKIWIF